MSKRHNAIARHSHNGHYIAPNAPTGDDTPARGQALRAFLNEQNHLRQIAANQPRGIDPSLLKKQSGLPAQQYPVQALCSYSEPETTWRPNAEAACQQAAKTAATPQNPGMAGEPPHNPHVGGCMIPCPGGTPEQRSEELRPAGLPGSCSPRKEYTSAGGPHNNV